MDIVQFFPSAVSYQAQAAHRISKFFETNELTTQQECDEHAASITGQAVSPTAMQGQTSYTVMATDSSMAVQFRPPDRPLNVGALDAARSVYGRRFVPACMSRGSWHGLLVYTMDAIQGDVFAVARQSLFASANKHILFSTISDFSLFFAASWTNRSASPDLKQIYHDYDARLAKLGDTLPAKFYSKLNTARNQLWRIFDGVHPIVLNHARLTESDIHIDPVNGRITGIVDWSGAALGPFGMSLWGVDVALGVQSGNEWHWHPAHVELRQQFWETLSNTVGPLSDGQVAAVKIGRTVGLFLAFGFCKGVPVEDDDSRLICLDALLAVE